MHRLDDKWRWARDQAEALRRGWLHALDRSELARLLDDEASGIRIDWIGHCATAIEYMLLIEHTGGDRRQVGQWQAYAWRERCDLGYAHRDCPSLASRHLEELLAESWGIGLGSAASQLARLDTAACKSARWDVRYARWTTRLSAQRPYSFEEILGRDPDQRAPVPDPDRWPAAVRSRLLDVLGSPLGVPDYPAAA